MSSRDISEAMAYERLQPFGDSREDYRAAMICHTMVSAQGLKKQGGGKFSISDFMPNFGAKEKSITDSVKEVFKKWQR